MSKLEDDVRVLYWSKEDTPIPKKGQVLENIFRERYKVVSAVRKSDEVKITFQKIE